jgi:calcium/calmodulin-dependent serine protein kinase
VDPFCNSGGINSGGQWPIPNCGGPMCHHGPGPGGSSAMSAMSMNPHMPMLAHGPSMTSLHGPLPPPPMCNPCSGQQPSFNSVPLPGSSRWGPRTSCPVHSPFRARIPNGSICSGHQVNRKIKVVFVKRQ